MIQPITDERSFIEFLDNFDARFEALGKRQGIAHFNRLTGRDHEDLALLNKEYADITLNQENRNTVNKWLVEVTDPRLKRRTELFAKTFLRAQVDNDPELFKTANVLEERLVQFKPVVNGKELSRSEMGQILESDPDRAKRAAVSKAGNQLSATISDDVQALFQMRNELARKLGYADFSALGLEMQDLKESELRKLFSTVKDQTEETWQSFLVQAATDLKVDKLEPWDLGYYMRSCQNVPPVKTFPKDNIVPAFKRALKKCGGDLDALPISVHIQDIPYGGLCMGIRFREDIRILVNPRDGHQWYDILFHEFGHGIQSSLLDASSYIVAGGDPPFFWEGIAGIFERIVHGAGFLQEEFNLDDQTVQEMQRLHKLERINWFRGIAVSSLVEIEAYKGDPDPERTMRRLTREYIGIDIPADFSGWAGNTLYTTHPLYNQNYLLMEVMALQTIEAARKRFGAFPTRDLFEFIRTEYIEPAGWIGWREKIRSATGADLSAKALSRFLAE